VTAAAAFFDLQVNGYAGVDFNQDELDADQLHRACERLDADGVAGFLATIITDDLSAMCRRLSRLAALREVDPLAKRLIAGVHIEGPFLSDREGYRGAHPLDAIRPADVDSVTRLLDAARGLTRVVTLAPESDPGLAVTRFLASQGIIVSAGHTDATLEQLRRAIDAGLSMFTHVGNGCPMHMNRHDNIIQRALSLADELWLCFIADGAHIPFVALRNYLKLAREDRTIIVTDAIAPAGLGPGRYRFGRWDLEIGEDMVARAPDRSHLVGSGITMQQNAANLLHGVGLSESVVRRLTLENPRVALGI
jgi:N-acetylglucosamine-6-phosphate deacetylase